jgi:HEAT repeat protein
VALRASILILLMTMAVGTSLAVPSEDRAKAEAEVVAALRGVDDILDQAEVLASLAWPDDPDSVPPLVREEARAMLIPYRDRAVPAIRAVVRSSEVHSGDAMAAMVEARMAMESGLPTDYYSALDEALWFGSREARRVAMIELARFRTVPNILAVMDAAEEDPALRPTAISTLAALRSDRARFWLAKFLNGEDPELRDASAAALATIGGRALAPLKEAASAEDAGLRGVAVRALLPATTPEDLTALYEYLAGFPDDPPELLGAARERALELERIADAWHESQSATPD